MAAAHVEQAPGGHAAADQVEQAARGGPAAGLLVEVGLVLHAAVEVVEIARPRAATAAARCRNRGTRTGRRARRDGDWWARGARTRRPIPTVKAQIERPRADPTFSRDAHVGGSLTTVGRLNYPRDWPGNLSGDPCLQRGAGHRHRGRARGRVARGARSRARDHRRGQRQRGHHGERGWRRSWTASGCSSCRTTQTAARATRCGAGCSRRPASCASTATPTATRPCPRSSGCSS